ncbi:MAG: TIGR03557 family F420-dependent LLM class oxidoreductase [Dehalococcoidia bacterium]
MTVIGYHGASEQFAPDEIVALAVAAEEAGFEAFSVSDHLHPWMDSQGHAGHAWITLAAIAQRTERLVVGTGVTCPSYRYHPVEVAQAFATLGVLAPGRVFLGLGTGEALNEEPYASWGPYRERAARLVEATRLIRALWTQDWVDFAGEHFQARTVRIYDKPSTRVPVYIAASGPRSGRIAAEEGDGWITDPYTFLRNDAVRQAFEEGARASGKDPGALPHIVELYAVAGDREEALEAAKTWRFLPVFPQVVNVPDPREVQRIAEENAPLEHVIAPWTVSPDATDHVAAVRKLIDRGATHVMVHSPQHDQRKVIEFYGREVLPELR